MKHFQSFLPLTCDYGEKSRQFRGILLELQLPMLDKTGVPFQSLPDIASETVGLATGVLDSVGMSGIEVPVSLLDSKGQTLRTPARVEAYVNLSQPEVRGIHMSRLFRDVQLGLTQQPLALLLLAKITEEFLRSHEGLSDRAELAVSFEALLERAALKSANSGWRSYPVKLRVQRGLQKLQYFVEVLVTYSSTCPASAALSRQLIQQNFKAHFSGDQVSGPQVHEWLGTAGGINATPHAQRSFARVEVQVKDPQFDFIRLIDLIEESLQTPVQTMVKREDEQEFALRNGQNLMFCEDAARRVKRDLESLPEVVGYSGEFRHVESLHPHDAVAKIRKENDNHS